jgi:putative endonuclease
MAHVYVLYSESLDSYYTGSCLRIDQRLNQHLSAAFPGSYTSRAKDWVLFFQIDQLGARQSRRIENHIKRMKSRIYIENLKKYPEISERLRKKYKDKD